MLLRVRAVDSLYRKAFISIWVSLATFVEYGVRVDNPRRCRGRLESVG